LISLLLCRNLSHRFRRLGGMERERVSNDELDLGIAHFLGLVSAGLAAACEWLIEADRRQQFLADGARDLGQCRPPLPPTDC